MNDQYKELTIKMTQEIKNLTYKFLMDSIDDMESISYSADRNNVMNLIISAHVSSMIGCLANLVIDDETSEIIEKFSKDLLEFLECHPGTDKVEEIYL